MRKDTEDEALAPYTGSLGNEPQGGDTEEPRGQDQCDQGEREAYEQVEVDKYSKQRRGKRKLPSTVPGRAMW
jgi:hypothetical protein